MGTTVNGTPGDVTLDNPSGLTAEQLQLLWDDLGRLGSVSNALAEAAMRYVVDDQGEQRLLADVAGTKGTPEALKLVVADQSYSIQHERRVLHMAEDGGLTEPACVLRLASVYAAAASRWANSRWKNVLELPDWLNVLLLEGSTIRPNVWGPEERSFLRADVIEEAVQLAGEPADLLVRAVRRLPPQSKTWGDNNPRQQTTITGMIGFDTLAARHVGLLAESLRSKDAATRLHVLELMDKTGVDPQPVASEVVDAAVCGQKTVRHAAQRLLGKLPPMEALALLQARAQSRREAERTIAAQLLQDLDTAAATAPVGAPALPGDLPPVATPPIDAPLSPAAREALVESVRATWAKQKSHYQNHPQANVPPDPDDQAFDKLVRDIETWRRGQPFFALPKGPYMINDVVSAFASRGDVTTAHLIRCVHLLGHGHNRFWHDWAVRDALTSHYFSRKPRLSLREMSAALVALGFDAGEVGRLFLEERHGSGGLRRFDPADVWPYFAEHPQTVESAWNHERDWYQDERRRSILKILATFPRLPERFARLLWDVALGGTKKERPLARTALANEPDRFERVIATLASGKAEQRAIAAEWLAEIASTDAVEPLRKALAKEKQDAAAGAMMSALESLGVPLEQFISLDGLLKEAKSLVAKGVPKDLDWFPFDKLPKVRWAKNDKPIDSNIVRWLVLQSYKLADPEPGPRLRTYADQFRADDRRQLGQFVLDAWVAHDLVLHTPESARAHADKFVNQYGAWAASQGQSFRQQVYDEALMSPAGSAIKSKGVLAIAGACCGAQAAHVVEAYLKKYYGFRVHQCRALVRMLAWVDDPAAIQLLLSVSRRFRTAGIRQQAEQAVAMLAERKGWTIDELADRTIPTAGFEEGTPLMLDYGPRQFKAMLTPDLDVTLTDGDGQAIRSLPEPRQSDDAEKAKSAKKQLSVAKKELSAVVSHQKDRLYEAMCTGRRWKLAEWDQFLHRHPVARHLCRRLVWATFNSDGSVVQAFRPLGDGTFTDAADGAVTVAPDATIGLAHESMIPAELASAWQNHLADYEIVPLFTQFRGGGRFELPDAKRQATSIDDFIGYLVEAFKLRSRLTKLGYTRGPTADGGWFFTYVKRFPSLGVAATIEHTGNGMPEENRTIALRSLSFARSDDAQRDDAYGGGGGPSNQIPLGELSPVLLSECWADLRAAASDGSGFDPDWEKKTEP